MNINISDWIDGQIVLQSLHISVLTLARFRASGRLPFSKIGKKIYYKRSDIDKMLGDGYRAKGGR